MPWEHEFNSGVSHSYRMLHHLISKYLILFINFILSFSLFVLIYISFLQCLILHLLRSCTFFEVKMLFIRDCNSVSLPLFFSLSFSLYGIISAIRAGYIKNSSLSMLAFIFDDFPGRTDDRRWWPCCWVQ